MSDDLVVRALVMQTIAEASMCWSPLPTGVYDDRAALQVGERLLRALTACNMAAAHPAQLEGPPLPRGERVIVRCPLHGSPMYTVTAAGIEVRCRSCRGLIHFLPHTDIEKMRRGLAFLDATNPTETAP